MNPIRITITAEPTAKARARTVVRNGVVRTYTPEKTLNAEAFLRERFSRHKDKAFPAHVPVRLFVTFYRTKSKYLPKKESMPFRKPDLDNIIKSLTDALNGTLLADDSQLTEIFARKRWSDTGEGYIVLKLEEDSL